MNNPSIVNLEKIVEIEKLLEKIRSHPTTEDEIIIMIGNNEEFIVRLDTKENAIKIFNKIKRFMEDI